MGHLIVVLAWAIRYTVFWEVKGLLVTIMQGHMNLPTGSFLRLSWEGTFIGRLEAKSGWLKYATPQFHTTFPFESELIIDIVETESIKFVDLAKTYSVTRAVAGSIRLTDLFALLPGGFWIYTARYYCTSLTLAVTNGSALLARLAINVLSKTQTLCCTANPFTGFSWKDELIGGRKS